jgi:hypothetical protein
MPEAGMQATLRLYAYFEDDLRRRTGQAARGDLVSTLVAAEASGKLTHEELLGYIYILAIAGNETTTKLIGNIVYQLDRHPRQKQDVLADRALVAGAVEETMRYDGPTQMMARTAATDVEVHGQRIEGRPEDRTALHLGQPRRAQVPRCRDVRRPPHVARSPGFRRRTARVSRRRAGETRGPRRDRGALEDRAGLQRRPGGPPAHAFAAGPRLYARAHRVHGVLSRRAVATPADSRVTEVAAILRLNLERLPHRCGPRGRAVSRGPRAGGVCGPAGFAVVNVEEHHDATIGWLPSPLILAALVIARTQRVQVRACALLVNLYDPLRLAEDIAILDVASRGRFVFVMGQGYRPSEYHALDRDWGARAASTEHVIETLLTAWRGEPFEYRGRRIHVSPRPYTRPHPPFFYGGMSAVAVRRAARYGLPYFPPQPMPELEGAVSRRERTTRHAGPDRATRGPVAALHRRRSGPCMG